MRKNEAAPGIAEAVEFITNQFDRGTWKPGDRLPATRELARMIGISQRTMIKAVAELKARELVSGVKGGCLRAGTPDIFDPQDPQSQQGLWQMKRTELERDIISGLYAHDRRLPSLKELQSRYGVSYRPLRKILISLVEDGMVKRRGKSYELPLGYYQKRSNRILFITQAFPFPARSALNPEEYRLIDRLEYECIRRELRLEVIELDFANLQKELYALSRFIEREQALGFVFDIWWTPQVSSQYERILDNILKWKRPVAIVDEWDGYSLPEHHRSNALLQVYKIEGRNAGARIAQLLLNLGHRSVAYISFSPDLPWSQNRLAGIMSQYSKAGLKEHVHAFPVQTADDHLDHILFLSGLSMDTANKIIGIGRTSRQAEERFQAYKEHIRKILPDQFSARDKQKLREIIAPLASSICDNAAPFALEFVNETVIKKANACIAPMLLSPLFEKALALRDITAWICASDIIAYDALQFLEAKSIRVPSDISLIGFDNVPVQSPTRHLTSFDFNARSFAYQMLDFILRPNQDRGRRWYAPIEIEGIIMLRRTTGKAKLTK